MDEGKIKSIKIENIVASGSIAEAIDLDILSTKIENCDLNVKRFPGAVYRITDPKMAFLIFNSGKVVITGVKNDADLARGLEILIQKVKEAEIICLEHPTVAVTNIVCSYDMGRNINLNRVVMSLSLETIEYEPEQFPGLVYRIHDPKIVALLFSSGKIILTGGKIMDDIERGVVILEQKLSNI